MKEEGTNKINREALFSAETEDYRSPMEPKEGERVRLRLRTAKADADQVYYIEGEKEAVMKKTASDPYFDYYEHEIAAASDQVLYHFKVKKNKEICLYNRLGPVDEADPEFDFKITPGFYTPDWAKGAVMYQIFTDRFCN